MDSTSIAPGIRNLLEMPGSYAAGSGILKVVEHGGGVPRVANVVKWEFCWVAAKLIMNFVNRTHTQSG